MKVGIFPNLKKESVKENLDSIKTIFKNNGIECILHSESNKDEIKKEGELLVILGGDGTFLRGFSIYKNSLPFIGINFGKFGFLSYSKLSNINNLIAQIKNKEYTIGNRPYLQIEVVESNVRKIFFALNEATLIRDVNARLIEVPIYIDGVKIGPVPCDGLIISTPTGSTAYNLSAGGPIVHPRQKAMIVSFMLSHSLFSRSVVLDKSSNIEINMRSWDDRVFLIIDGREKIRLNEQSIIKIVLSKEELKFIETKDYNFIKILENKFGWGKRAL